MPIPTRTLSLREPQTQRRKPAGSNQDDTATSRQPVSSRLSRTSSVSTSTSTSTLASAKPPSGASHAHTTPDSNISRSRSLLPQRHVATSGLILSDTNSGARASATERSMLATPKPKLQTQRAGLAHTRTSSMQTPGTTRLDRSASLRQPTTSRTASVANPTTGHGHARHRSQVLSSTNLTSRQEKATTDGLSASSRAAAKPQFNTFQQQYSPKKLAPAPKPSISSLSTAAGEGTGNNTTHGGTSLPTHVPPLQVELLQLHLLHSQALRAKQNWETSADEQCRKLHASVKRTYQAVLSAEREIQRARNAAAIEQFASDIKACNSRYDFPTQVQMLSRVMQTVMELTKARDGRYNLAVREFEEWSHHAMEIRIQRSQSATKAEVQFIESLSDAWRNEVAALSAKLELCARELDCLEIRDLMAGEEDASALVRAFKGHKVLVHSMVEELDAIAKIEAEMMTMEREWVKSSADAIINMRGLDDNVALAKPVWMGA